MLWSHDLDAYRAEARRVAEAMRQRYAVAGGALPAHSMERLRAQRAMASSFEVRSPRGADEVVAGVPCRRFAASGQSRGTYLHMHGGAFVMGSPLLNDSSNADLAERLTVDVVSVDYRLAPEHPFPAAADDCFAVAAELVEAGRPLVVGGESAGANLVVLTLLRLRDELDAADAVAAASLVFGPYDLSGTPSSRGVRPTDVPDSREPDPEGFTRACYLPGHSLEDTRDPRISPLYASLHGMPPALFTIGTADRLLDDSLFMAARWEAFGNQTQLAVYPDCGHSFLAAPMELARIASRRIEHFLDEAFSR